MATATADFNGDLGRHVEQVCDKEYPRLQRYFLREVGDISEADEYVRETFRRFFLFMKGRDWEREEEYTSVYLMRLAALLYLEKLWDGPPRY